MNENIVYYSYKMNQHSHVNVHEMDRFEHSISSLREFNNEIPVYLFCDDPDYIPDYFRTEYKVRIRPFEDQLYNGMLFIYRRFNLRTVNVHFSGLFWLKILEKRIPMSLIFSNLSF